MMQIIASVEHRYPTLSTEILLWDVTTLSLSSYKSPGQLLKFRAQFDTNKLRIDLRRNR